MKAPILKNHRPDSRTPITFRNQLCSIVDKRPEYKTQKKLTESIAQKKNNVLQRGVNEARALWDSIHPMTFEAIATSDNQDLIEAWNTGRDETDKLRISEDTNLGANRTNWKTAHEKDADYILSNGDVPSEIFLASKPSNREIDYSIAMIGQDNVKMIGQKKKHINQDLKTRISEYYEENEKFPFTLSTLLQEANAPWSKPINKEFIKMVVSNRTPVEITSEFFRGKVAETLTSTPLGTYDGEVSGTLLEIKYLVSHGYRNWQDPKLEYGNP